MPYGPSPNTRPPGEGSYALDRRRYDDAPHLGEVVLLDGRDELQRGHSRAPRDSGWTLSQDADPVGYDQPPNMPKADNIPLNQ